MVGNGEAYFTLCSSCIWLHSQIVVPYNIL